MQATIRTTVRIRKDLLDQSKLLALKEGTSLQEVINNALALGFGKISDIKSDKIAMEQIDKFRSNLSSKNINLEKLLGQSKLDQK